MSARSLLVCAVVVVAGIAGQAHARVLMCELEDPVATSPSAATVDEPRAPVAPSRERLCLPGALDDAGCWPESPIPPESPYTVFGSSDTYLTISVGTLIAPDATDWLFCETAPRSLSPGHARRIDRPPRFPA